MICRSVVLIRLALVRPDHYLIYNQKEAFWYAPKQRAE